MRTNLVSTLIEPKLDFKLCENKLFNTWRQSTSYATPELKLNVISSDVQRKAICFKAFVSYAIKLISDVLGVYRSFDILGVDSSRVMTSSKPLMFSVTKI